METHVKVVGALHILMGALGVLGAFVLMLIFGGVASLVSMSGDPDAAIAVPAIGMVGMLLVVGALVLAVPAIFVGVGLWRCRPWARVAGIVISILDLALMPLGTLIGIYGLCVLFSKPTEALFTGAPATLP
jgi:hypothetical protein